MARSSQKPLSKTPMPIVIAGAGGRMGEALMEEIAENALFTLAGALEKDAKKRALLEKRLSVPVSAEPQALCARLKGKGAVIDFTREGAPAALAPHAAQNAAAYIVGTTGLSQRDETAIKKAARQIPVLYSGNMSLGVALLGVLITQAAQALKMWDIEIQEMHHAGKEDAPSGTALLLGEAAASGRGKKLSALRQDRRAGMGRRKAGSIGFASLRGGTAAGEHSVLFLGKGERILLHHSAETRRIFAHGALQACLWARGRKAGLYSMRDVLGVPLSK